MNRTVAALSALLLLTIFTLIPSPSLAEEGLVLLTSRRVSHAMSDLYEYDLYLIGEGLERQLTNWAGPEGEAVYSARLGTIIFTGMRGGHFHLWAVSPGGGPAERLTKAEQPEGKPTLSPCSRWLAYPTIATSGRWALARLDLETGERSILFENEGNVVQPEWSPGGDRIAFVTDVKGSLDLWLLDLASGKAEPLTDGAGSEREPDWSPNGRQICYTVRKGNEAEIYLYDVASGRHRQLTDYGVFSREGSFSPDGKSVIFVAALQGPSEVYRIDLSTSKLTRVTNHPSIDSNPRLIRLVP